MAIFPLRLAVILSIVTTAVLCLFAPEAHAKTIAAGLEFTCMIKEGAIQCVGEDSSGQLGNGQTSPNPVTKPVKVALPVGAKPLSISAGHYATCAILSDQSLTCWGANTYGQLGNGTTTDSATPVTVVGLALVTRVALGAFSACAVTPTGMAYCWGHGDNGQMGAGANLSKNVYPAKVSGLSGVLDVGVGGAHACALVENGQVYCWGDNTQGQLGTGDKLPSNTPVAVKDGAGSKYLTGVTSLTVGLGHACALLADKTGRCWGNNYYGQLGAGENASKVMTVATPIFGGSAMEEIVANSNTTCARVTNGQVYCWGDNSDGQFGNGVKGYATTPMLAFNGQKVSAFGIGFKHICVVSEKGQLSCRGSNDFGQLGLDTTPPPPPSPACNYTYSEWSACKFASGGWTQTRSTTSKSPVVCAGDPILSQPCTPPPPPPKSIAAGSFFTCAIRNDAVYCWGNNQNGQSGADPTKFKTVLKPTAVDLGTTKIPKTIAAGDWHACVLFTDKTGKCWGANNYGQLGDGSFTSSYMPVDIAGWDMEDIVANRTNTCVRVTNGNVYCWGNLVQEDGTTKSFNTPNLYSNGPVGTIAASPSGYCTITLNGIGCNGAALLTVGWKVSQNSVPTTQYEIKGSFGSGPVAGLIMPGASEIRELGVGGNFICASASSGQVACAGEYLLPIINEPVTAIINQPLGIQASPNLALLVPVNKVLSDVQSISAGLYHACAVRQTGHVACWGADWMGELGQGTVNSTPKAVMVPGVSDVTEVAAGNFHTCALTKAGDIKCWGSTSLDALGPEASIPDKGYVSIKNFCAEGMQSCGYAKTPVAITGLPAPTLFIYAGLWTNSVFKYISFLLALPALDPITYWDKQQKTIYDLYTQLAAATVAADKAYRQYAGPAKESLESAISSLVGAAQKKQALPTPATYPQAAAQAYSVFTDAQKKQLDLFQQLDAKLGLVLTESSAAKIDWIIHLRYRQAMMVYFSTFFNLILNQELAVKDCTTGPIASGDLINFVLNPEAKLPAIPSIANKSVPLLNFLNAIRCQSETNAWAIEQALGRAYLRTMQVVYSKITSESERTALRDELLLRLSSINLAMMDISRGHGTTPAKVMTQEFAKRLAISLSIKPLSQMVYMGSMPPIFFYNPTSKTYENLPLYSPMSDEKFQATLPQIESGSGNKNLDGVQWSQIQGICAANAKPWKVSNPLISNGVTSTYYNSQRLFYFAADPVLWGDGSCPFWDSVLQGKMCCPKDPKKTSLLMPTRSSGLGEWLSNILMPSAHAEEPTTRTPVIKAPADPYARSVDPNAAATADIICPPDRCYEERDELVFKSIFGTEHRYPNMTRGRFIDLQLQRIATSKALEKARTGGVESTRNYLLTAPLIVRGTPTTQTVESPKDGVRRTLYTVTVSEVLKGKYEQPTLTLVVPGGCITKDDCETVLGLRTPQINQEFVFLLNPLTVDQYILADLSESVYRIENGRLPDWNIDLSILRERAKMAVPPIAPATTSATPVATPAVTAVPVVAPVPATTPVVPVPVTTPTRTPEPVVAPTRTPAAVSPSPRGGR